MNHRNLQEEYSRLRAQLADAYNAPRWETGRIDRLADELAALERRLARQPPDTAWTDTALAPEPPRPSP
ncbi:MAG: hypothetical protein ACK4ZD_14640 [Caldimonas sp.]|uniref:hypothetical protein n=1 Tax=Caldimonas sp. TaxID=2838790 RepID=UPI00391DC87E